MSIAPSASWILMGLIKLRERRVSHQRDALRILSEIAALLGIATQRKHHRAALIVYSGREERRIAGVSSSDRISMQMETIFRQIAIELAAQTSEKDNENDLRRIARRLSIDDGDELSVLKRCQLRIKSMSDARADLDELCKKLGVRRVKSAHELIDGLSALSKNEVNIQNPFDHIMVALGLIPTGNWLEDRITAGRHVGSAEIYTLEIGIGDNGPSIEQLYRDIADSLGVSAEKSDIVVLGECCRKLNLALPESPSYRDMLKALVSYSATPQINLNEETRRALHQIVAVKVAGFAS